MNWTNQRAQPTFPGWPPPEHYMSRIRRHWYLIRWFLTSYGFPMVLAFGTRACRRTGLWNTPVVWNSQSVGIEQLVANQIIVPPGGNPVVASWDRPFFYVSDPNSYPTSYGPVADPNHLQRAGLSTTHPQTRTFWWGLPTGGAPRSRDIQPMAARPGICFPPCRRLPAKPLAERLRQARRPTSYGRLRTVSALLHHKRRRNLEPVNLPGVTDWSGFDWAYYLDARTVTADRVLPNTFYLYYAGQGVYQNHGWRRYLDTSI